MSIFDEFFEQNEEQRYKAISDVYSGKANINFISEFSKKDISVFMRCDFLDDFVKKELGINLGLKKLVRHKKEMLVSYKRSGKKEWVEVVKSSIGEILAKSRGLFSRGLGL